MQRNTSIIVDQIFMPKFSKIITEIQTLMNESKESDDSDITKRTMSLIQRFETVQSFSDWIPERVQLFLLEFEFVRDEWSNTVNEPQTVGK